MPILMYHDVANPLQECPPAGLVFYYSLPRDMFRDQLRALRSNGYRAMLYHEVRHAMSHEKVVVITFDDGWKGNFVQALPILRECEFAAVFFVTVSAVGSSDYMDWDDLRGLVAAGMSVQSHGLTHRPMEELDSEQLIRELRESKTRLESELDRPVDAISFPHGSYNSKVIRFAAETGYEFFFTSDVYPTYRDSFLTGPRTLARIPITTRVTPSLLLGTIRFSGMAYWKDFVIAFLRKFIRSTIGIENYRSMYRRVYRIQARDRESG